MINKVLIANRGEIAVRIIRACRIRGIKSVAVYSESDRYSLHVKLADESICIGEGPAFKSYLNQDRVLSAAEMSGADAIHPGYGFLAENPDFVRRCEELGITFIGPKADVMELMGNKSMARKTMVEADVPVVPGSLESLTRMKEALKIAEEIGFPVMIKATAGGGGKGMRAAFSKESFPRQFELAQRETKLAFDDDRMYVEKLIENPRHIEIQVLGDTKGNVIALGERDCSVQRNHQKMIEESPSPFIDEATRKEMNEVAVRAAKAVRYVGAGTIEFIMDEEKHFHFMEMNTRIQVEHPVTEMVTGIDLVDWQIRIANGETLTVKQEDVVLHGHSIECRINAEAPMENFRPSPGKVGDTHLPGGNGVRVDTFIYTGYEIPTDYDSMIMKIIVHSDTREEALRKMMVALDETVILGIETNLDFQYQIIQDPGFQAGMADTGFIEQFLKEKKMEE